MAKIFLNKALFTSGLGISCFFAGTYYQGNFIDKQRRLPKRPALPIFGTVSAASPFTPEVSEAKVSTTNRISQIMKYGFPCLDNVRSFEDYVLSYDRRNKVAHWVFEHLTAESVQHNSEVDRSKCDFKPDESIHPFFRFVPLSL